MKSYLRLLQTINIEEEPAVYAEIASQAKTTVPTVKSAFYRARRKYENQRSFVKTMDSIGLRLGAKKSRRLTG